jgi:hypothetical protein
MNRFEQAAALSKLIDDAFVNVVWPAPQNLVAHPEPRSPTFRDLEEPFIRANFGGKRQSDLSVKWGMIEELLSMTGLAVQYYLPCFLKAVIDTRKPDEMIVIGLIDFLDIEKSAAQGLIWPQFTGEQQSAVLAFVEFVLRHIKSYELGDCEDEYRLRLQMVHRQWKHVGF